MKHAILEYGFSRNFGDEVQMIAASQFMPPDHVYIARETFENKYKEKCLTLMNGYFARDSHNKIFPPDDNIIPVYTAMHLTRPEEFLTPDAMAHLKQHAPIGCRDKATAEAMRQCGIEAFESKCLTLTFSKRQSTPNDGEVLLVTHNEHKDIKKILPTGMREKLTIFSHTHRLDFIGTEAKMNIANCLLSYYRNRAKLVITNLVHCALPCVAMGIPVVFFDTENEGRTRLVEEVGLKVNHIKKTRTIFGRYIQKMSCKDIDYNPKVLDIDDLKNDIIKTTENMIGKALERNGQKVPVPKFKHFNGWK